MSAHVYSVHMSEQSERILDCACDLYLRVGLDEFSMRKLAREVGVTAPALYRHYDGREAVLGDVLREAHRTFSRYLYGALGAPTPLERFLGAGEGYLNFVIDHPRWYGILHTAPEHLGMETFPDDIQAMKASIHQFWNDRVRECMQAGILKEADPAETSITMWAHAHGMVQLYHEGCLPVTEDEFRVLFQTSGAQLMAGVATESFAGELAEMVFDDD
jgi:AcrR family transcriptional regulator